MSGVISSKEQIPHNSYIYIKDENQYIVFDSIISDSINFENSITEHSIENGAVVSDHIRKIPNSYVFTAIVSNKPLFIDALNEGFITDVDNALKNVSNGQPTSLSGAIGGAIGSLFGAPAYPVNTFKMLNTNNFDYKAIVLSALINAHNKASIIEVDTACGYVPLKNLVIQTLQPQRSDQIDFLRINITLKEIKLVSSKKVQIEYKPADLRGGEKKSKGRITQKAPESASLLSKLGGF